MVETLATLSKLTDEELIFLVKYRLGDPAQELIARYTPLVEKMVGTYWIPGYEKEDLRQEAYESLFRSAESYNPSLKVSFGYFLKINITNRFTTLRRKMHTDKRKIQLQTSSLESIRVDAESENNWEELLAGNGLAPDTAFQLRDAYHFFYRGLTEKENEAFTYYKKGLTTEEIADALSCSSDSVKNTLARCRYKLKQSIQTSD